MIVSLPTTRPATPAIESFAVECGGFPVAVRVSRFRGAGGVAEYHLAVSPVGRGGAEAQLDQVLDGYQAALESLGLDTQSAVFRRFYCSDLANEHEALRARLLANPRNDFNPCAVSWAGQPPVPPAKVALWACHVDDPASGLDKSARDNTLNLHRGALTHHWTTGLTAPGNLPPDAQTRFIFEQYGAWLKSNGLTLAENVVRTWLLVRDVDADYAMLVQARRAFFAENGLTPETHFIASTGIGGAHVDPNTRVAMDAYAIAGLRPEQVRYLTAPEHLSPTHIYGVTFERGTTIAYRDRKHILISGTASIDAAGQIVFPGDVSRQFDRAVENVAALMADAGATLRDLAAITVYVRDPSDLALAVQRVRACFGDIPALIVVAPVCRPGWLVEIEGMGILPAANPELPPY